MNRRDLLKNIIITGGIVVTSGNYFSCSPSEKESKKGKDLFDADDTELLNEIADVILPPSSSSPGAKSMNVGTFIVTVVRDCYTQEQQNVLTSGLRDVREKSKRRFAKSFLALKANEKLVLLEEIDNEAKLQRKLEDLPHYFLTIKKLVVRGYFTSEGGTTMALRYVPVPGRYEGCVDYKPGNKAFA